MENVLGRIWKRFRYKGDPKRKEEVERLLSDLRIDRKAMYLVLNNFEINQDFLEDLRKQYPDVP